MPFVKCCSFCLGLSVLILQRLSPETQLTNSFYGTFNNIFGEIWTFLSDTFPNNSCRVRYQDHDNWVDLKSYNYCLTPGALDQTQIRASSWRHQMEIFSALLVRGIHRSPVNSPHKGQWRGALMFSLICTRISCWVNNGDAGDLRHQRVHYDVTVMWISNNTSDSISFWITVLSSMAVSVEVRAWMTNHTPLFYMDVITHAYPNPDVG